jgi:cytidine deaminase
MEDYGSSNGPELVFGLVGPIGTDMDCVVDELKNSLRSVGYDPHLVHITALLPQMLKSSHIKAGSLSEKINLANQLRSETGDESILATIAFARIREIRGEIKGRKRHQLRDISVRCPRAKRGLYCSSTQKR